MQPTDLNINQKTIFSNVFSAASALLISDIAASKKRPIVCLLPDEHCCQEMAEALSFFSPKLPQYLFPAWDCLPYDRLSPSKDISAKRIETLCKLIHAEHNKAFVVIASVAAAMQKLQPKKSLESKLLNLKRGERLNRLKLHNFLIDNGFQRVGTVRDVGEFAIRGDIVDLYPAGHQDPIRIDMFDDLIEKIMHFDPISQLRSKEIEAIDVYPTQEIQLNEDSIARFRSQYRETFGVDGVNEVVYESISEGKVYAGMEHWLPFFYENTNTIFDYVPNSILVYDERIHLAFQARLADVDEYFKARHDYLNLRRKNMESPYRPLPPNLMYMNESDFKQISSVVTQIAFRSGQAADAIDFKSKPSRNYSYDQKQQKQSLEDVLAVLKSDILHDLSSEKPVIVACYTDGSCDRIQKLFADYGLQQGKRIVDFNGGLKPGLYFTVLKLSQGFDSQQMTVLTEADVLGDRLTRSVRKERKAENFIQEASSLHAGDYVVHLDHGIGRFINLETVNVDGHDHDCLMLEYAGGDKLFVPVENIELLSRYGGEEGSVTLDRLGGASWQARKAKAKERIREIAGQLIKLAAERQLKQAETCALPKGYDEFCARFLYAETEDQLRAIHDVEKDLQGGKPMDRLICGDVGFGKTEVAMRAAFIAASNGLQVAVIVPTTLLARQHSVILNRVLMDSRYVLHNCRVW